MRKGHLAVLALGSVLLLSATSVEALRVRRGPEVGDRSIVHDGLERTYKVHLPRWQLQREPRPLVLVLHGGGGTGPGMERVTRYAWDRLADREGFIVAYPDGIENHWNDGRTEAHYRAHEEKIDDVGFLSVLIDKLIVEENVDPLRVYVTGISNGGLMSFYLAMKCPEKIAAIAPVAALLIVELKDETPPLPMPVMLLNGTDDPLVPYEGGEMGSRRKVVGRGISTDETIAFWVRHNGCDATPERKELPDTDPNDGTRVTLDIYSGGEDGSDVVLCKIEGGGHTWPGGVPYLPEWIVGRVSRDIGPARPIWDFLKKHRRVVPEG
jgi:polyhydroxybutyrate depolymerase